MEEQLKQILDTFEEGIKAVEILHQENLPDHAVFIFARLTYSDDVTELCVPFVLYHNEGVLFTPYDWQEYSEDYLDDYSVQDVINGTKWYWNNSEIAGVVFNGAPRLFGF